MLAEQTRALMLACHFDAARVLLETAARISPPASTVPVAAVVPLEAERRKTER